MKLLFACFCLFNICCAQTWISTEPKTGYFALIAPNNIPTVVFSSSDYSVVAITAREFVADIQRVTSVQPRVTNNTNDINSTAVIIGSVGTKNTFVDKLVESGKLDVSSIKGKFESFLITTVKEPFAGISEALVIAGSDRRGTAFGVYEVSQAIGVSPWYWWADVAVDKKSRIYVAPGIRHFGPPSVKYRGIFINDEDWGIQPWAAKTFDPQLKDIGPKTYEKVFELLLRLKANTLWPAMHHCTHPFNYYTENRIVADNYGIIMSSSHAEPMLRNNVGEWKAGANAYNYLKNRTGVYSYWEQRVVENRKFENIYTLGMRGIHDSPIVGPTTDAQRIATLEQIFKDQREILAKHVNSDVEQVPQQFCPYKEVLTLYKSGLKVPDDVTILWPDDNHGYIRQFATTEERKRKGGYGIYYHISYLGTPLSYVWMCSTPHSLIWEEMTKAYDYGADRIWILNVGDIKPGEYMTEFFLQHAWDINKWKRDNLNDYLAEVSSRDFGAEHGKQIAEILKEYYELNYQRKPEHLQWWFNTAPHKPSPFTHAEMNARLQRFANLRIQVSNAKSSIPSAKRDAFYELIEYPVAATALANERYFWGEESSFLSAAGNTTGHDKLLAQALNADAELKNITKYYNEINADGKWNGMMSLDSFFNGSHSYRPEVWKPPNFVSAGKTRVEDVNNGEITVEAEHFVSNSGGTHNSKWEVIPGLGRSGDSVALFPTLSEFVESSMIKTDSPKLSYNLHFNETGNFTALFYLIPTLPINEKRGLRFAIALNDEQPTEVVLNYADGSKAWWDAVMNATLIMKSRIHVSKVDNNSLVIYGTDPGVVIDKITIDLGGIEESYLGPKENV